MPRLLIYRIVTDGGHAPHISNGYLTLTICKPIVRKSAAIGDYVLALVAQSNPNIPKKESKTENKYFLAAYLFKVTDVIRMENYESWCKEHSPDKICTENSMDGNCQYGSNLSWRPGPHWSSNKNTLNKFIRTNLSGVNAVISNYYAAWKSSDPHVLTDDEITGLGLTRDEIKKIGIGQKFMELPNTITVDAMIDKWNTKAGGKLKHYTVKAVKAVKAVKSKTYKRYREKSSF